MWITTGLPSSMAQQQAVHPRLYGEQQGPLESIGVQIPGLHSCRRIKTGVGFCGPENKQKVVTGNNAAQHTPNQLLCSEGYPGSRLRVCSTPPRASRSGPPRGERVAFADVSRCPWRTPEVRVLVYARFKISLRALLLAPSPTRLLVSVLSSLGRGRRRSRSNP